MIIGSFSNEEGDGNKSFQNGNRLLRKNNNFARASHFIVHFFTITARLGRENVQFHVVWRT